MKLNIFLLAFTIFQGSLISVSCSSIRSRTIKGNAQDERRQLLPFRKAPRSVYTAAKEALRLIKPVNLKRTKGIPELAHVGNNWKPSGAYPLQMCEGDCDDDNDCAGDLICFQRNTGLEVPGCKGSDESTIDYCTNAQFAISSPSLLAHVGNNGKPEDAFPLKVCQGDCDTDDECSGNLVCFHRSGGEEVPGCEGSDVSTADYCISPRYSN